MRSIVGDRDTLVSGYIPFTTRAKRVIEGSLGEMQVLGHESVDVGHLMLSLLHLEEGVGHQVRTGLGADVPEVGRELVRQMSEETP